VSKIPRPVRIVVLYSAGHLGSALIMNRLVDMGEIEVVGYGLSMVLPASPERLLPAWKIARERNIPVFETRDINAADSLEFVRQCQPDLLVSAYFSQILKSVILQIARLGVLNVHPGWLPSYRGAMAYFWVLHNPKILS
jgi:folate-dependent phosphoribosylglycinamide formyltransferase PurN